MMRRFMLSSALLVFLALVALLIAFAAIIFLLPSDNVGKEMLDREVYLSAKTLEAFNASAENWASLDGQLAAYDYNLLVIKDDQALYSSLNTSQTVFIDSLKALALGSSMHMGKIEGVSFAACAQGVYGLYALSGQLSSENTENFSEAVLSFIGFCLLAIAIILILSQFSARIMARRFLRPLTALSEGAKRIENGDLSKPVIYDGKDEFAAVCAAFNHMQEHLSKERKKNALYEKARTDLIAGISHDLRTPLTSIKGYVKGLRDNVANTPEKRARYLTVAYQKACDMDLLLQELFFFSKLETGNLPLTLENTDLGDFARRFVAEAGAELEPENIKMTACVTDIPHPVRIDKDQMRRVLFNLVENALKYAGAKPLRLTVAVRREHGEERLLFSDNGQGVEEELLPHIFDQFWRKDESRNETKGSGLGLHIVKYIVETHGGTVTARNDNGLVIEISLPQLKEAQP